MPDTDLDGSHPRETLKRVGHLSAPCQDERCNAAERGVEEDGSTKMIDVRVVDHVATAVELVEAPVFLHISVQTVNESKGKEDEEKVVEKVGWRPVDLVLRQEVVPSGVEDLRNESRADDEHVLLPNWSTRWRSTKWKFVISLLVGRIGGDVERGDKLPQVSLQSGLQVPCGLGSNTVNLVVRSSREGVDSDGALSGSTGGFGRRLIACVIRCDGTARGRDVVGELLLKIWSLRRRRVSALGDLNTSHPFLYRRSV